MESPFLGRQSESPRRHSGSRRSDPFGGRRHRSEKRFASGPGELGQSLKDCLRSAPRKADARRGRLRVRLVGLGKEKVMSDLLITIAVVLLVLWLLGLVTSYTIGGFIHILLVIALIALLIRAIRGRPV